MAYEQGRMPFETIVHADWSLNEGGRWAATARRQGAGWRVDGPAPVGDLDRFRHGLIRQGTAGPVLAGFDFPIGLPAAYAVQTGFTDFPAALPAFGTRPGWEDFYAVATSAAEITIARPFYPGGNGAGTRLQTLVDALNLPNAGALLRACERGGDGRKRASPLFWTVGAAQVGRAAARGWQSVIAPALAAGAVLWPFDGTLADLSTRSGLVIAETYPADAYALVGATFTRGESKRRQGDRARKAGAVLRWAEMRDIDLSACADALRNGFGASRNGEDAFDALLGLLAAIAVVDGEIAAMTCKPEHLGWEGWILGR